MTQTKLHMNVLQLNKELEVLKVSQKELGEQWEHEKEIMSRIQSIKEEVTPSPPYQSCIFSLFPTVSL
jgi:hypothetical protein